MNKPSNITVDQTEFSFSDKEKDDFDNCGTPKRPRYARGRGGMCSRCQEFPSQPKSRYCLKCHAAHMRAWRKTHPMSPEQRFKDNARSMANAYQKRGKIKPQPCEVCGEKAEKHHDDYSKPLEVRWLCRKHHLAHHRKPTEKQLQKVQMEQRKRRAQ